MTGEKLVIMCFPAYPFLAETYGLNQKFELPWHVAKHLIGNSMHVANVGVWQSVVATCVHFE